MKKSSKQPGATRRITMASLDVWNDDNGDGDCDVMIMVNEMMMMMMMMMMMT